MKHSIDWATIDWSKTNKQLAEELGMSQRNVAYHRNGNHERQLKRASWRIDWTGVDWSKPDAILAEELSCTAAAVSSARNRFGVSEPSGPTPTRKMMRAGSYVSNGEVVRIRRSEEGKWRLTPRSGSGPSGNTCRDVAVYQRPRALEAETPKRMATSSVVGWAAAAAAAGLVIAHHIFTGGGL